MHTQPQLPLPIHTRPNHNVEVSISRLDIEDLSYLAYSLTEKNFMDLKQVYEKFELDFQFTDKISRCCPSKLSFPCEINSEKSNSTLSNELYRYVQITNSMEKSKKELFKVDDLNTENKAKNSTVIDMVSKYETICPKEMPKDTTSFTNVNQHLFDSMPLLQPYDSSHFECSLISKFPSEEAEKLIHENGNCFNKYKTGASSLFSSGLLLQKEENETPTLYSIVYIQSLEKTVVIKGDFDFSYFIPDLVTVSKLQVEHVKTKLFFDFFEKREFSSKETVIEALINFKTISVAPKFDEFSRRVVLEYVKLNFIVSTAREDAIRASVLVDEVYSQCNLNLEKLSLRNNLLSYISELGIKKKRCHDGMYYFGLKRVDPFFRIKEGDIFKEVEDRLSEIMTLRSEMSDPSNKVDIIE